MKCKTSAVARGMSVQHDALENSALALSEVHAATIVNRHDGQTVDQCPV